VLFFHVNHFNIFDGQSIVIVRANVLHVRRGCLDIAAMSVVMNQAQVKQQASLSVMKSAMSTAESNGAALIEMLNSSSVSQAPHPSLGGQVDVKG